MSVCVCLCVCVCVCKSVCVHSLSSPPPFLFSFIFRGGTLINKQYAGKHSVRQQAKTNGDALGAHKFFKVTMVHTALYRYGGTLCSSPPTSSSPLPLCSSIPTSSILLLLLPPPHPLFIIMCFYMYIYVCLSSSSSSFLLLLPLLILLSLFFLLLFAESD